MANIKIAQLTNQLTLSDTDTVIVETATSTNKMTVGVFKQAIGGIEESGNNDLGRYVKYSDGTMICTLFKMGSITLTSSLVHTWEFPKPFIDDYSSVSGMFYCIQQGVAFRQGIITTWQVEPQNKFSVQVQGRDIDGGVFNEYKLMLTAIGRWK